MSQGGAGPTQVSALFINATGAELGFKFPSSWKTFHILPPDSARHSAKCWPCCAAWPAPHAPRLPAQHPDERFLNLLPARVSRDEWS